MNDYYGNAKFEKMVGATLVEVKAANGDDEATFRSDDRRIWRLFHEQSCCEGVSIDDVCGDISDLIGEPITQAEVVTSGENPEGVTKGYQYSFTWTFYKLATRKGSVTIRWYGESNGYYSEAVTCSLNNSLAKPEKAW